MKSYSSIIITGVLSTILTGCHYIPQNFDNKVQISRTGQYQIDVDSDFTNGGFLYLKAVSEQEKKPLSAADLKKIFTDCESEYKKIIEVDQKNGKHIISSQYLGECRIHAKLQFTGNIIKEKTLSAIVGDSDSGINTGLHLSYDQKNKVISVIEKSQSDKKEIKLFPDFKYNGSLKIKTDGKVISNNADSTPYWGLIGSYKWKIVDFSTPDASIKISSVGI